MKAECLITNFKAAVAQIEKVAGKNLTLPILGAILIQTDDAGLVLRATNLNIGAELRVPAKVSEHGTIAVSAQLLGQITNGLSGDAPVSLESVNDNLVIKTKHAKMTVKSMNADDFPTLPHIKAADVFEIPTELFVLGVKSVAYAASQSDIKPEIASIYLYPENDHLVFVATDAFRLAEKKIPARDVAQFPEILIPVKNIGEIVRILGEYQGTVGVRVAENQISFTNDQLYLTSRLTAGTYPPYRQIMPKESKTEAIMLRGDLQGILKSMMVFSDKYNQIDVAINPTEKTITFTSQNGDTGEGVVSAEAALSGQGIETRMNQRYISDALQSISVDSVSFSFTEPNRAMVMRGVGDQSFTYLVMPMNR